MKGSRYRKLDGIRGFALLNMIAYHAVWDLVYLYGVPWDWYRSKGGYIWQQGICWTFIFLSGFCLPLGQHPVKRGLTVFGGGAVITVVTLVLMPQNRVVFGVLTLIGSCMIITGVLDKRLRKLSPLFGLLVSFGLFYVTRNVNNGWLGFERGNLIKLPDALYANLVTTYLGFPKQDFYSTDYFSLVPWLFLFWSGYFLFHFLKQGNALKILENGGVPPLEWLGKHSFVIYMLHQPVIYLIFMLLKAISINLFV